MIQKATALTSGLLLVCVLIVGRDCLPVLEEAAHDHSSGENSTTEDSSSSTMAMYFYFSEYATILFRNWQTTTWGELIGSSIAMALLGVVFEALKAYRQYLTKKQQLSATSSVKATTNGSVAAATVNYSMQSVSGSTEKVVKPETIRIQQQRRHPLLQNQHIFQSFLHLVQVFLGMCLMLVYMTFNVPLCIGIVVGQALGYYFFAWVPLPHSNVVSNFDECCQ